MLPFRGLTDTRVEGVAGVELLIEVPQLRFGSLSADTMLVGHLPFTARLAGRLVTGDEHAEVVTFVPGTVGGGVTRPGDV